MNLSFQILNQDTNFLMFPETIERRDSDCNTLLFDFEFGENLEEEVCSDPSSSRKTLTSDTSKSPVAENPETFNLLQLGTSSSNNGFLEWSPEFSEFYCPVPGKSSASYPGMSKPQCAMQTMPPIDESWFEDSTNLSSSQPTQSLASNTVSSTSSSSNFSNFSSSSSQFGTSSSISSLENLGGSSYSISGESNTNGSNRVSQKRLSMEEIEQQIMQLEFLMKNNPKLNNHPVFREELRTLKNRRSCKRWRFKKRKLDKVNTEKIASLEKELKKTRVELEERTQANNTKIYGVFKTLMGFQENHVSNEAKQFIREKLMEINGD